MEAKFTPGPHWVEGSIYEGYVACVVSRCAVEGQADRETRTLAHVRTLPDALLYAAASDLLEALIALRDYGCPACSGDCGSANPPMNFCPMQKASAAIAKALNHEA